MISKELTLKLLLYCTKSKPYLIKYGNEYGYNQFDTSYCKDEHKSDYEYGDTILNGKIVAECDFEVEEIETLHNSFLTLMHTDTLLEENILKSSCLTFDELDNYLKKQCGYAIHIKNLHIFDKSKELSEYDKYEYEIPVEKAPQNMMYCYDEEGEKKVLISIQPQWLCKILNGEKTIEIRKKVLKEMVLNDK